MKIGLYFGSFNPVHIGHLAIANYMLEFTELEQIWFVVSPQNPFKQKKTLLKDYHRIELIYRAIGEQTHFKVSDIEIKLPKPSYTIDTLVYLNEKYPQHSFSLIMGSDNLENFHKWKNFEQILNYHTIYVYPRSQYQGSRFDAHPKVQFVEAPQIQISSSFIRENLQKGKELPFFMPTEAYKYLQEMNFYKTKTQ